jgi:hypothetical protein
MNGVRKHPTRSVACRDNQATCTRKAMANQAKESSIFKSDKSQRRMEELPSKCVKRICAWLFEDSVCCVKTSREVIRIPTGAKPIQTIRDQRTSSSHGAKDRLQKSRRRIQMRYLRGCGTGRSDEQSSFTDKGCHSINQ